MEKSIKAVGLFFYGLILSSIVAAISFGFLYLESHLSEGIWEVIPEHFSGNTRIIYIFIIAMIGGLIVGYGHQKWGALPQTTHQAMSELKQNKTVAYQNVFKSLLLALLILTFGAGVGPEAALLAAIISLSVWQADKMRYYFFNYEQLKLLSIGELFKRLALPNQYLLTYDEKRAATHNQHALKKIFYTLFIINGLIAFVILMKWSGQPSFVSKMGTSHWQMHQLWIIFPLMLIGIIFGVFYDYLSRFLAKLFSFSQGQPILKALIGSIAIFCVGLWLPNLLFSGQLSLALVPYIGLETPVFILLAVALLKLIYLEICLNTGWIGGNIFPIVFSSIILGFATAQLIPQIDALLIVAIVATSISVAILKQPLVVGIFMALFFPLNLTPIILGTTLLFMLLKKLKKTL